MIAPRTGISARPHQITLDTPGAAVTDGDGGYTQTFDPLSPATMSAKITPATAADLERVTSGTVLSSATHVVTMPHHSGVNTKTRITFGSRTLNVVGVSNPDERSIETIAVCAEVVA